MNLFWPVYKSIEKEVLDIASYIHIDDSQLDVYSILIGELIVRCAMEVEALSKSLYEQLGGDMEPQDVTGKKRDLYFDTDCLDLIEQEWKLSSKEIILANESFYIVNEENRILTPLRKAHKRGTSGAQWKQAYQAIKHNRIYSLPKATIRNLLNALGALFILNVYYRRKEIMTLGRYVTEYDDSYGSAIFTVHVYEVNHLKLKSRMDDDCILEFNSEEREKGIGILKYQADTISKFHNAYISDCKSAINRFLSKSNVKQFIKENPECVGSRAFEISKRMNNLKELGNCMRYENISRLVRDNERCVELVVNLNKEIYSDSFYDDSDDLDDVIDITF